MPATKPTLRFMPSTFAVFPSRVAAPATFRRRSRPFSRFAMDAPARLFRMAGLVWCSPPFPSRSVPAEEKADAPPAAGEPVLAQAAELVPVAAAAAELAERPVVLRAALLV